MVDTVEVVGETNRREEEEKKNTRERNDAGVKPQKSFTVFNAPTSIAQVRRG